MKSSDLDIYLCPDCRSRLNLKEAVTEANSDEILEWIIVCSGCGKDYPIRKSIPRFVKPANYASSFGYQWEKFARTQVGGIQKDISKERFDATTKWLQLLEGQRINGLMPPRRSPSLCS